MNSGHSPKCCDLTVTIGIASWKPAMKGACQANVGLLHRSVHRRRNRFLYAGIDLNVVAKERDQRFGYLGRSLARREMADTRQADHLEKT